LFAASTVVKILETESRIVVARGWREEKRGSYYAMGREFQFCKMKNSRDLLHNNMNILGTTQLST